MTSLFWWIEFLGRGNPANYRQQIEPSSCTLEPDRFMHFRGTLTTTTGRLHAKREDRRTNTPCNAINS
ncbi:hypothetical protein MRX96_042498 [Rhipicephalus microplus]